MDNNNNNNNNDHENGNNNDNDIPTHSTAYLTPNGDEISFTSGIDGSDFLLLTGEPINEPIEARGSMVMNTNYGIDVAYNDYNSGKMGRPWDHSLTDDEWKTHVNQYPSIYR
jgi:redox-sensitive bicupin YhaK (pirin superfamily)